MIGSGRTPTIAARFTWQEQHSVHVEDMDVQHRRLISFVDDLMTALRGRRPRQVLAGILSGYVQYLYIHFADEEQFMGANGFPGLADHAAVHEGIYRRLSELQQRFEAGECDLVEADAAAMFGSLEDHFIHSDRGYGEYFSRV